MHYFLVLLCLLALSCTEPTEVSGTSTDGESTIIGQVIDSSALTQFSKLKTIDFQAELLNEELTLEESHSNKFIVEFLTLGDSLDLISTSEVIVDSLGYFEMVVAEQGNYAMRINNGDSVGSFIWPIEVQQVSMDLGSIGTFKPSVLKVETFQLPKECSQEASLTLVGIDTVYTLTPNDTMSIHGVYPGITTLIGVCNGDYFEWDVNIPGTCSTINIGKLNWVEDLDNPGNKPNASPNGKKGIPIVIDQNCEDFFVVDEVI